MNLQRRFAISLATIALTGGLAGPAAAADTASVAATVSMIAPCLTVSTRAIDFGPLMFSTDALPAISARDLSYRSCSDVDETVFAHVTSATEAEGGSATWQPTGSSTSCSEGGGMNRFWLHLLAQEGLERYAVFSISQPIEVIGQNRTGRFSQAAFTAPCAGSVGSGSTMSFSIVFTATF